MLSLSGVHVRSPLTLSRAEKLRHAQSEKKKERWDSNWGYEISDRIL